MLGTGLLLPDQLQFHCWRFHEMLLTVEPRSGPTHVLPFTCMAIAPRTCEPTASDFGCSHLAKMFSITSQGGRPKQLVLSGMWSFCIYRPDIVRATIPPWSQSGPQKEFPNPGLAIWTCLVLGRDSSKADWRESQRLQYPLIKEYSRS